VNERERHLQTGRSWPAGHQQPEACRVERPLRLSETAPFCEVRADRVLRSDPSASHLDPNRLFGNWESGHLAQL
jgi:hypothetical protein